MGAPGPTLSGMTGELRLVDGDAHALERRLARALAERGEGWTVARFTYWYTSRPPVHEAVLMPQPPGAA